MTRVRITTDVIDAACGDHPGLVQAVKGDVGELVDRPRDEAERRARPITDSIQSCLAVTEAILAAHAEGAAEEREKRKRLVDLAWRVRRPCQNVRDRDDPDIDCECPCCELTRLLHKATEEFKTDPIRRRAGEEGANDAQGHV
jgi:hypothetical protein